MGTLQERRAVPVGTERVWGGKKYVKTGEGWKYVGKAKKGEGGSETPVPNFRAYKAAVRAKKAGAEPASAPEKKPARKGFIHTLIHHLKRLRGKKK